MKRLSLCVLLLMAACSSPSAPSPSVPPVAVSESPSTPTVSTPTPTVTPTPTATPEVVVPVDVTGEVKSGAGEFAEHVVEAAMSEPRRVAVSTDLSDSRAEKVKSLFIAVALCDSTRSTLGDIGYLRVNAEDGSALVLFDERGGSVAGVELKGCTRI